jgi:hypothetical protein
MMVGSSVMAGGYPAPTPSGGTVSARSTQIVTAVSCLAIAALIAALAVDELRHLDAPDDAT